MPFQSACRSRARWRPLAAHLLIAVGVTLTVGCADRPQIEMYEVARTAPPRQPLDADAERARLDHMFAAILVDEADGEAWFFKATAPGDQAAAVRDSVESFLKTVRLEKGRAAWDLPEDWKSQPGDKTRFATLLMPSGGAGGVPLELTVTKLPYVDPRDAFLAANVNRWQEQLGEQPLPVEVINKIAATVETNSGPATLFELIGPSRSGDDLRYGVPKGWKPGEINSMRKAAFNVEGAGGAAEATVTVFPGQPGVGMGNVAANLNRWAGEVGLRGLSQDDLQALAKPREIAGSPAVYAELIGPDGDAPLATLAAMLPRRGMIWFFKLKGDRATVEAQRDAFGEFLDSVQFR